MVAVCPSEELSGGAVARLGLGGGDSALGSAGDRRKSCGLLAPGKVMSCGLLRLVMSCGLLGLTPGGYPPGPCARAKPPARSRAASVPQGVAYVIFVFIFMVRFRECLDRKPPLSWIGLRP